VRVAASGADDDAYHVQDTDSSQVYRGLSIRPEMALTPADMNKRAAETRGVVLTWQSRPFSTYFASTCGGHTTEAATSELDPGHAAEPLRGVTCGFCATSPKYRWTKHVSDADLVAGMKNRGFPVVEPLTAIEVTQAGRGGWAKQVTVTYGANGSRRPLPGTQFRSAARLLSHRLIDVRRVEGGFEIDGGGWGHGVGMCQWGAFEMGKRGFSETDILRAYYPGITFTRVY
jgi:stage II sporulation protein D